jgi:hypothetical protein
MKKKGINGRLSFGGWRSDQLNEVVYTGEEEVGAGWVRR